MRKFMIVAACTALAACGSKEEPAPTPTETATASTDTATASQMAGDYEVRTANGTTITQTLNADGTYVDKDATGAETERGTWRQQGEQLCYAPEGGTEQCYTGGAPGPDGRFEVRDSTGTVSATVKKVAPETAPAMAPAQ